MLKLLFRNHQLSVLVVMVKNNILEYVRDFTSAFFTFIFPLIFIVIFSVTGNSQSTPQKMRIKILGQIENSQAQEVIKALREVPVFSLYNAATVRNNVTSDQTVMRQNALAASDAAVIHFTTDEHGKLVVQVLGWRALDGYLKTALQAAETIYLDSKPVFEYQWQLLQPDKPVVYKLLPAFFAMALLQIGLFATSAPLLQQRANSVLRHFMIMPISSVTLVSSLLIVRLIMAALQMLVMFLIGHYFLGLTIDGSVFWFVMLLMCGTLCFVSMGFAIGGFMRNAQVGTFFILILNFLMLGFGGIFITSNYEGWAGMISYALPIGYLVDGLKTAVTGVEGSFSLFVNISVLLTWTLCLVTFSIKTFKYDLHGEL
ncbi:ABC-2 protein [Serratia fonticola AU-P3(3)]|nr:ABC-2 protein [Serratia fonticola AU-P3(3)]